MHRQPIFRTEFNKLLRLSGPLITSQLLMVSVGVVDTIMLGHYGDSELAAVALGSSLWLFIYLSCHGVMMSISPITAQHFGAGRIQSINHVFCQGIWLALLIGVIGFLVFRNLPVIFHWLTVDPLVVPLVGLYLHTIAWGFPAIILSHVPRFVAEGCGHTRPVMMIYFLLLPLNILGDYLFIYGHWGFPELGIRGAALTSAITMILVMILFYVWIHQSTHFPTLTLRHFLNRFEKKQQVEFLHIGLPISLAMLLEVGLFTSIALMMGRYGKEALAAHQIISNYASLMYMIPVGLSLATAVVVGQAVGAGEMQLARYRGWMGILLATGIMSLSALIMIIFPEQIIAFYTDNDSITLIATQLIFVAALFQISDAIQICAMGGLRGYKDTRLPMYLVAGAYWLLGFPLAWYLGISHPIGPIGLWYGIIGGLSLAAILLLVRFRIKSIEYVNFRQGVHTQH